MKNKLMLTALLGLLLVGSFSYAEESDDEAKKRLLKEYEKVQKEREKEAERAAKEAEEAAKRQAEEGTQSAQDIANQAPENAEGVVATEGAVVEGEAVPQEEVAPKKARKDMTESEKMDLEVQRIKKRMLEINDKIENYNKTNEMLDNLEKNVGELEKRVSY